jgi:hypothetical protein
LPRSNILHNRGNKPLLVELQDAEIGDHTCTFHL